MLTCPWPFSRAVISQNIQEQKRNFKNGGISLKQNFSFDHKLIKIGANEHSE